MKVTLLLFIIWFAHVAQAAPSDDGEKVASKAHAHAVELVRGSGIKDKLQAALPSLIEEGKKQMMEKCQTCVPEFAQEWGKRMLERLKVDDFLDVYVNVYEKYFSDDELAELISLREKNKNSQAAVPSPDLKKKLETVMPSLLADSMAECSRISAKLGAEIGAEVEREHPEYTRQSKEDKQ